MFTAIQLVLILVILFAISRVYLRRRENVLTPRSALFWVIIWSSALIGVILPQTTTKVAEFFGVGRGVDIIVYISLTLLFYLVFRIYVMIEDIRNEITFLIRKIALTDTPKTSPKKKPKK